MCAYESAITITEHKAVAMRARTHAQRAQNTHQHAMSPCASARVRIDLGSPECQPSDELRKPRTFTAQESPRSARAAESVRTDHLQDQRGGPSPGTDVARGEPSPGADVARPPRAWHAEDLQAVGTARYAPARAAGVCRRRPPTQRVALCCNVSVCRRRLRRNSVGPCAAASPHCGHGGSAGVPESSGEYSRMVPEDILESGGRRQEVALHRDRRISSTCTPAALGQGCISGTRVSSIRTGRWQSRYLQRQYHIGAWPSSRRSHNHNPL